jgi:tRNA dimethylallyltransferase
LSEKKQQPLLVIVGETGSGKSALALHLAQRLDGELICADSWTVRREVTIGTAKPSLADQKLVPHHLVNVAGPDEDFTAALFKRLANESIDDIHRRGKLPILVGGTGLYIDGVIYDFGFLPAGDRQLRERLNILSQDELITKITKMGLELGSIDTGNKRRLIRLIETNGAQPTRQSQRANTLIIGIKIDHEELGIRINQRIDMMLKNGLEAEVRDLVSIYGWDCEALKGVGYAQWKPYFLGTQTLAETRLKIVKATLDLAKRQRTWFKRNKSIHWFSTPIEYDAIVDLVTTYLDTLIS